MNEEFQHTVHALAANAELAATPATNGLFDRGDLQDLIAGLGTAFGELTELCQELERERDFLIEEYRLQASVETSGDEMTPGAGVCRIVRKIERSTSGNPDWRRFGWSNKITFEKKLVCFEAPFLKIRSRQQRSLQ
jgi:hypothetical protein